jgi:hypothetical protein
MLHSSILETPFYDEWKNNFPDQETEEDQPIIGHLSSMVWYVFGYLI